MSIPTRKNTTGAISRRDFLALAGVTGGAALLASCKGPAAPLAATSAPAGPKSLSFKGTLELWDWEFAPRQKIIAEKAAEFVKLYPDIKVNYLPLPWADMETKILTVAMAGNGPALSDVFYFWRYDLQRANVITPFAKDFTDWEGRFSAPFIKDEQGRPRALVCGWYVDMIYYNKEIFAKEGLKGEDIPKNWDDFIKLAKQLTQKDANGKVTRSGCGMNDYWQHEYLWHDLIYQQGAWVYSEDGTKALWEEDASVKAVQFIQDWYLKHQIDSLDLPAGYGTFGNGLAAMMLGSGWNTGFMLNDFPQMQDKFDTVPIPTYSGKMTPSTGLASPEETFQVFTNFPAETQEAAFAFTKFAVEGEDNAVRWGIDEQIVPDVKSLINDPRLVNLPSLKGQLPGMPYRVTTGERPIEAEKLWRAMFDEVLLKNTAPEAALKVATDAINIELPKKTRYITERNYKAPA